MRLRAGSTQPIAEIAVRILIEVNDVCGTAIDREIPGTGAGNISGAGRGPTKQILRMQVGPSVAKPGTKPDNLIDFVLYRTLGIQIIRGRRPRELVRHRGI
jgi:hypothetical protein